MNTKNKTLVLLVLISMMSLSVIQSSAADGYWRNINLDGNLIEGYVDYSTGFGDPLDPPFRHAWEEAPYFKYNSFCEVWTASMRTPTDTSIRVKVFFGRALVQVIPFVSDKDEIMTVVISAFYDSGHNNPAAFVTHELDPTEITTCAWQTFYLSSAYRGKYITVSYIDDLHVYGDLTTHWILSEPLLEFWQDGGGGPSPD